MSDTEQALYPIADGADPAVTELANTITTASGGGVIPGLAFGVTSIIPNELTEPYTMTHRAGLGLDLDLYGATDGYYDRVLTFLEGCDLAEIIALREDRRIHVTVKPGKPVNLDGFPKPTKKKAAAEEEPAE